MHRLPGNEAIPSRRHQSAVRPARRRDGIPISAFPRPAEGKHLMSAANSPFPRPEIVHFASPESTAPDGVALRWRKRHR